MSKSERTSELADGAGAGGGSVLLWLPAAWVSGFIVGLAVTLVIGR